MDNSSRVLMFLFFFGDMAIKDHVHGIRAPWVSTWQTFTQNQPSPTFIPHPLNEYPAKVDVQIRVTEGSQEHIFSGIGSCQRDDDDPNPYGGIVYIYNHKEVKLYTPTISDSAAVNSEGGFAFTGGWSFNGPFVGHYTTADVRVRVWRMCDFPPANFTSANAYTVSTSGTWSTDIPHNMGYYPDLVIVQLKLPNNYISEAQGAVFIENYNDIYNKICGVIMAFDRNNVRLWSPKYIDGSDKFGVFCVSDGWASAANDEFVFTYASIYVQAWIFDSSEIVFTQTDTRGSGINVSPTITMPKPFDIDTHLFLVRSQAVDGANANYVFEGAGSALSDGSAFFKKIGAVVYSYNPREVNIWYPGSEDYLLFVGGIWGYGSPTQASATASVSVKVIKTKATGSGFGCSLCTSDWNTLTTNCSTSQPNDIQNAHKCMLHNITIYTCMSGYQSNGAKGVVAYNGSYWEETDYNCTVPTSSIENYSTMGYSISFLEEMVHSLKKNLTFEMKNTSAYRRSLTCATDPRPSAAYVGVVGILILILTVVLFLCADLSRFVK